ncbi:YigZ family protein [Salisediminibacterium halotolerans]|uniref:YigZ family protein n=1 Tax=Salisediminibacterium halotolerans TaxID=517425 RepID=UPI000EB547EA|nr:YigZ family protein [Salisediminibacterium halotolerans]RLJ75553.1 putative YigZ family protein [Actinophytocola xinjiangensis]RPE89406.1 putative YigZ family protein [Salisediminibacterium halotolerans]TWG36166.1 putative YigZ family protein [Salisediminibacterium halotolerans]GEL07642.1 YigZ family protein [Salisediminibacterium halotolerans]
MLPSYYTVKGYGEYEYVIQKSRFITYVDRVASEEEAHAFIEQIKKRHHDAAHNCSAYMIGENNLIQKANDDGEPSGTAGVPMLDVLKKRDLKDTVVVVTRYFGGIKLGAGGLIRAYGTAVSEGVKAAGIVERRLAGVYSAAFSYSYLGKVENDIRSSRFLLKEMAYLEQPTLYAYVVSGEEETFKNWIADITNGTATVNHEEDTYLEYPVETG